jgi:7-cyano-7-deazaguanine reductase
VVNEILDHLVAGISPRFMEIRARFNVRGGITTTVIARHVAENFVREHL